MKINIEINEEQIRDLLTEQLVRQILSERTHVNREAQYGVRKAVEASAKEYIYTKKEEIIEKVINRAVTEIIRKGMPKFIAKLTEEVEE